MTTSLTSCCNFYLDYVLIFTLICGLELVEKFVVVVVVGWGGVVANSEFSVLLWSKPFHLSLSFGLGPS